jgi:formate hydrogenlyase transcriptional activator
LFYRLNIFPVYVPPLRERVVDIIPLVSHFVQKSCIQFGRKVTALNRESLRHLQGYAWPGNIRELEHLIERAVLLADDEVLTVDLSGPGAQPVSREAFAGASKDLVPLDELERTYLQRVLESTSGTIEGRGGAAEILKLKASTLRSRLKKLGVPYGNRRRITNSS